METYKQTIMPNRRIFPIENYFFYAFVHQRMEEKKMEKMVNWLQKNTRFDN